MLIFIQWENSTPILFGQVVYDMTIEEVMDYAMKAVEKCGKSLQAKSAIFTDGNWTVKAVDFNWSAWEN